MLATIPLKFGLLKTNPKTIKNNFCYVPGTSPILFLISRMTLQSRFTKKLREVNSVAPNHRASKWLSKALKTQSLPTELLFPFFQDILATSSFRYVDNETFASSCSLYMLFDYELFGDGINILITEFWIPSIIVPGT